MSGEPTLEAEPASALEIALCDQDARVLGWRIERLIAVGFDSDAALLLALDRDVDLHEATGLVERGCAPETAFRILL